MSDARTTELRALAARAYVWGAGPLWGARVRRRLTLPATPFAARPPSSPGAPLNRMGHQRVLSDPAMTVGVAPNVDTLYSVAWLDLRVGAFLLQVPPIVDRYYTFQIATADTECRTSLGRRTHGEALPPVLILPRGHEVAVPDGVTAVVCDTRYVLVAGRILCDPDDPSDLAAVHRLQSQVALSVWDPQRGDVVSGRPPVTPQRPLRSPDRVVPPGLEELDEIGNVVAADPAAGGPDRDLLASFAPLGLTQDRGSVVDHLAADEVAAIAAGIADGVAAVEEAASAFGTRRDGWSINLAGPRFGDDHLFRAAVAREQVYVVPPEEALYPSATADAAGAPLTGERCYELRFAADALPPVDAFWSLTMYTDAGRLVPNAIGRHAVGDRTPGLVADDGTVRLRLATDPPADDDGAVWLPAPPGRFRVTMRLYGPRRSILTGAWAPPPIEELKR